MISNKPSTPLLMNFHNCSPFINTTKFSQNKGFWKTLSPSFALGSSNIYNNKDNNLTILLQLNGQLNLMFP